MMIGHQRDIMAALGIDVWIPKGAVCQPHQPSAWRDQAPPEAVSEIILPKAPARLAQALPQFKAEPPPKAEAVPEKPAAAEAAAPKPAESAELAPALQISAFSIEAVSLPHCVLLVDVSHISAEQQQLWKNIQRAVQAEFHALQWPFAWLNMQDGRGAASYVQGFLDALSAEKNVLCLGGIPHLQSSKCIQLASLQDMLDQPLLKKRLWQFMQNKIRD